MKPRPPVINIVMGYVLNFSKSQFFFKFRFYKTELRFIQDMVVWSFSNRNLVLINKVIIFNLQ